MLLEKKTSLYPPSGAAVLVLMMVPRLGLLLEKAGRSPARSGAAQGCARLPACPPSPRWLSDGLSLVPRCPGQPRRGETE